MAGRLVPHGQVRDVVTVAPRAEDSVRRISPRHIERCEAA